METMVLLLLTLAVISAQDNLQCRWDDPNRNICPTPFIPLIKPSNNTVVRIGLLFPIQGNICANVRQGVDGVAAQLAVEDINNDSTLLPNYHLELIKTPEYESCHRSFDALGYAMKLRYDKNVSVIIGPACGDQSSGQSVSSFAEYVNLPVVTPASFSDDLTDVKRYPMVVRMFDSRSSQTATHVAIYKYFSWKVIGVVIQADAESSPCGSQFGTTGDALRDHGYDVTVQISYPVNSPEDLAKLMTRSRVISVFARPNITRKIVLDAWRYCEKTQGCNWADYRFIVMMWQIGGRRNNTVIQPWLCDVSIRKDCQCCNETEKQDDNDARKAFQSVIQIIQESPIYSETQPFRCKLMERIKSKEGKKCWEEVATLTAYVYDSVLLYAIALNQTKNVEDGRSIVDAMKNINIEAGGKSKTGRIFTSVLGARLLDFAAYFSVESEDISMTKLLIISAINRTTGDYNATPVETAKNINIKDIVSISDVQPCNWDDLDCGVLQPILIAIGTIVIIGGAVFSVVKTWCYFQIKPDTSYLISIEKLKKLERSLKVDNIDVTTVKVDVVGNNKTIMSELRELHNIHHPNIIKFLYFCLETERMILVLTEKCSRGNLQSIILTDERIRTSSFVHSFSSDIAKGLSFLHESSFSYHGFLTSQNCLVDNRWVVKLSGFAPKAAEKAAEKDHIYCNDDLELNTFNDNVSTNELYSKLWHSPEVLRGVKLDDIDWRKSDIFSFGIILGELLDGNGPYGISLSNYNDDKQIEIKEQIDRIISDKYTIEEPTYLFEQMSNIKLLRKDCLQEDPEKRPDVKNAQKRLMEGSTKGKGTMLDQWITILEQRSIQLQNEFDKKSNKVQQEKERSKNLVLSLLPKEIAELKMRQERVEAQYFSRCSFFFSDIKGFTSIVSDLGGPMEVVTMLDNMYVKIDEAIEKYGVVKIETIGDAYVVASGVPELNGNFHASKIASFALEVLSVTKGTTIAQLDHRPVHMRIGIHSGDCVAGVAGKKMYHYCLYGKEVKYANLLESSGESSKIHMSNKMKKILEQFYPKFKFVQRDIMPKIEGFPQMKTFWLIDEQGEPRDMPNETAYLRQLNMSGKKGSKKSALEAIDKDKLQEAEGYSSSSGRRRRGISASEAFSGLQRMLTHSSKHSQHSTQRPAV